MQTGKEEGSEASQMINLERQTDMDMGEDDAEEMDLCDLHLDDLEKVFQDPDKWIIPS